MLGFTENRENLITNNTGKNKKYCVVINNKLGTKKVYLYMGYTEIKDTKTKEIRTFHNVKEEGRGNKKTFSILVGSKDSNVYLLN